MVAEFYIVKIESMTGLVGGGIWMVLAIERFHKIINKEYVWPVYKNNLIKGTIL